MRDMIRSLVQGYRALRPFAPVAPYPRQGDVLLLLAATVLVVQLHPLLPPWWVRLIAISLCLWRVGIERVGWPMPSRFLRWALTGAVFVIVLSQFHGLHGRNAGTVFLMLLIGLKGLEMRHYRDVMVVVFLVWWVTLTGFLFSQSPMTAACGLLSSGLALTALIRMNQSGSTPRRRVTHDALGMLSLALPIMLGLYLLFPRIQGGLWGAPNDPLIGRMGLTEEVSPGSILHLLENDEVAFRAQFDGPAPPVEERYWRALVLESTDGRTWRRGVMKDQSTPLAVMQESKPIRYTTTFEPSNKRWLPALDWPVTVPPGTRSGYGHVLASTTNLLSSLRLELTSDRVFSTTRLEEIEKRANLQLAIPPTPRVKALVAQWRSLASNPAEVVRRALGHFQSESFYYSLSPASLGDRPVDQFMFDTREGYCEHYASAFTTLMRVAGIPARMVVGYMGGEVNDVLGYVVVRQSDAHAWSEVWLPASGWTRVDPTAAIAPERIRYGIDLLRSIDALGWSIGDVPRDAMLGLLQRGHWDNGLRWVKHRFDAANYGWNKWVMDFGPEQQFVFLRTVGLDQFGRPLLLLLLVIVVGLLLWVGQSLLSMGRLTSDPLQRAYQYFLRRMGRLGLTKHAFEGPLDFAERAIQERPDCERSIRAVTQRYVAARYGLSQPVSVASEIRRLTRSL